MHPALDLAYAGPAPGLGHAPARAAGCRSSSHRRPATRSGRSGPARVRPGGTPGWSAARQDGRCGPRNSANTRQPGGVVGVVGDGQGRGTPQSGAQVAGLLHLGDEVGVAAHRDARLSSSSSGSVKVISVTGASMPAATWEAAAARSPGTSTTSSPACRVATRSPCRSGRRPPPRRRRPVSSAGLRTRRQSRNRAWRRPSRRMAGVTAHLWPIPATDMVDSCAVTRAESGVDGVRMGQRITPRLEPAAKPGKTDGRLASGTAP